MYHNHFRYPPHGVGVGWERRGFGVLMGKNVVPMDDEKTPMNVPMKFRRNDLFRFDVFHLTSFASSEYILRRVSMYPLWTFSSV